ncbi:MAG: WecB/TagA/CpsF family glycosyltransferase [Bacteroidota bacterium]|nr:WecB/TagA/CpsF family glycosyltransferase [Bacteroidota bacterium]
MNGITLSFAPYDEIISFINTTLKSSREKISLAYVNAHTFVTAEKDSIFKRAIKSFTVLYADGIGMRIAIKLLFGKNAFEVKPQNASDLNNALMQFIDSNKLRVFFLGSTIESLNKLKLKVIGQYPTMKISGVHDGYFDIHDLSIVEQINQSRSDILMIGLGHPKQELWLEKYRDRIEVPVCVVVGAFIDFASGEKIRAPLFIRNFGFEWFFRLIQEPRRLWKRYIISIPLFCYIVLKQKLTS